MHFFQPRYAVALITAIIIDFFQFLIAIVLWAAFSVPGVAGGILGCVLGSNYLPVNSSALGCGIGTFIGGLAHLVGNALTGGALQEILIAVGAGLGSVIDFSISVVFGTGLLVLMWLMGMIPVGKIFSWRRAPFMLAKIIPGIDALPFIYTGMVVLTILENEAKNAKGVVGKTLGVAALAAEGKGVAAAKGAVGAAASATHRIAPANENAQMQAANRGAPSRTRTPLVDGVRQRTSARQRAPLAAANDNGSLWSTGNENALQTSTAVNDNTPSIAPDKTSRERNAASLGLIRRPGGFNPLMRAPQGNLAA